MYHIIWWAEVYRMRMEVSLVPYDHRMMGNVIRTVRKQKGKSQDVISGFAGLDRTHLAKIELGHHSASVETLWAVAEALDMRLSDLFRMVEEELDKIESE